MNRDDLEFVVNMLMEILGDETEFLLVTKGSGLNGCAYKGKPSRLAESIFETMHKDDETSKALLNIVRDLGYNLIKNPTKPARKFTETIFTALEEPNE